MVDCGGASWRLAEAPRLWRPARPSTRSTSRRCKGHSCAQQAVYFAFADALTHSLTHSFLCCGIWSSSCAGKRRSMDWRDLRIWGWSFSPLPPPVETETETETERRGGGRMRYPWALALLWRLSLESSSGTPPQFRATVGRKNHTRAALLPD